MQINIDCMKDVLEFCINNIDYETYEDTWITKYVNLNSLYVAEELNKKYEKKDIMRSVLKLVESHFIKVIAQTPLNKPYINSCYIEDVTILGYRFYEATKEPSIWQKTKLIASKVGNHALDFIENIAHDVAVESAKEIIKISLK